MDSALELFSEALRLQETGQLAAAQAKMKVVCQMEPKNGSAHINYIQMLIIGLKTNEAEEACYEALRNIKHGAIYFLLGSIFSMKRSYIAALQAFTTAAAIGFEIPPLFNNLAYVAGKLGDVRASETFAREALKRNPNLQAAYSNLTQALHIQGQSYDALEYALRLNQIYLNENKDDAQKLTADQILDLIDSIIPADSSKKKSLVYIFSRSSAIGHITQELPYIKTLFHDMFDEIIVIVPPIASTPKINRRVFDACMRGVRVVETDQSSLLLLSSQDIGTIQRGERTYLLWSYFKLFREFMGHIMAGGTRQLLCLTDDERTEGQALLARMGVPHDARIVVLHVRTSGYYGRDKDSEFRNLDIRDYFKTICRLVALGYVVIRIGDPSMPRLPDFGPQVIDAPFHPEYEQFLELAAFDRCEFMIACNSGPCSLARAMGKPILVLNCPPCFCNLHTNHELLAFRRCYDVTESDAPRLLSYGEILERGICDFLSQTDYELANIRLTPLGEDELVEITMEMIASLKNPEALIHSQQQQFMALSRIIHERCRNDPGRAVHSQNWFGYALPGPVVSARFCEFHGRFLYI